MKYSKNKMSAHKNFFQTSDFILYTLILLAVIFEFLIPTSFNINQFILIGLGIFLLLLSWTIILTAKYQFKKYKQKSGPNNEITQIIKTGIFAYTRNPIYLGVVFIPLSIGLLINSIWVSVASVLVFISLQHFLIIPEEKYLRRIFGTEFERYCLKVRRWF